MTPGANSRKGKNRNGISSNRRNAEAIKRDKKDRRRGQRRNTQIALRREENLYAWYKNPEIGYEEDFEDEMWEEDWENEELEAAYAPPKPQTYSLFDFMSGKDQVTILDIELSPKLVEAEKIIERCEEMYKTQNSRVQLMKFVNELKDTVKRLKKAPNPSNKQAAALDEKIADLKLRIYRYEQGLAARNKDLKLQVEGIHAELNKAIQRRDSVMQGLEEVLSQVHDLASKHSEEKKTSSFDPLATRFENATQALHLAKVQADQVEETFPQLQESEVVTRKEAIDYYNTARQLTQTINTKFNDLEFLKINAESLIEQLGKEFKELKKNLENAYDGMVGVFSYRDKSVMYKEINDLVSGAGQYKGNGKSEEEINEKKKKYTTLNDLFKSSFDPYKEALISLKKLSKQYDVLKEEEHPSEEAVNEFAENALNLKEEVAPLVANFEKIKAGMLEFIPPGKKKNVIRKKSIIEIDISDPTVKKKDVAAKFPLFLSNEDQIGSDMINSTKSGYTGFKYKGAKIYHSSSGSSVNNNAGTAFWTVRDEPKAVFLLALGKHWGNSSDEYKITWKADGVKVPTNKIVKLNTENKAIS